MRALKDKRGIHNRPYTGEWISYRDKEERKHHRRMFKAVRHKLLMCIPLTDEEDLYRIKWGINADSKMDYEGFKKY